MSESRIRQVNPEIARLERQVEELRRQAQETARHYQRELERLQQQLDASVRQANEELVRRHRQELDSVAAAYNEQRTRFMHQLALQRQLLNRRIEEESREIERRVSRVEGRIEAQLQQEKRVADEYRVRMRREWAELAACEELKPYIDAHTGTIEQAENSADRACELKQYQAVTAIMVNSSALISCWETEARALWEEWQALNGLCSGVMNCMNAAMSAAEDQPVDCDGDIRRARLLRYDSAGFARAEEILQADRARMESARNLSIEEMRMLLHELERDQRLIDDLTARAMQLHRAHVRRLRCLSALTRGLKEREFLEKRVVFEGGDLLKGIRALYCSRYQRDRLLVQITSPEEYNGMAQIRVTFLPGAAMDEMMQHSRCQDLTQYASALMDGQAYRPVSTRAGDAYRNRSGLFEATVTMQYQT